MSARPISAAEEDRTTARLLYTGAVWFLVAAKSVHERYLREPSEPEHWPALSVNLCFATELSLKAFLASRGKTQEGVEVHWAQFGSRAQRG